MPLGHLTLAAALVTQGEPGYCWWMQARGLGLGGRERHREGRLPLSEARELHPTSDTTIQNFVYLRILFYSYSLPSFPLPLFISFF